MEPNPAKPLLEPFVSKSFVKFISSFKTEEQCLHYLYNIKFANGFTCSRCGCEASYKGPRPFTLLCQECEHVETATSGTLFHRLKIPLTTAFMLMYDMAVTTKGISARSAAVKYGLNKDTAWLFMRKVKEAEKSSLDYPMMGKVYVDEFVIGQHEPGAVGRTTDSEKIKAIMAVEVTPANKVKRLYAMRIQKYTSDELRTIFDKHISKEAVIYTDGWRGYSPLKGEYNIIQNKDIRNNSPVNRMIQQMKSTIRGIYHSIGDFHCESYFDEFAFRINRSQNREIIFHTLVERMVLHERLSRLQLSQVTCRGREKLVERVMYYENWNVKYEIKYGKVKLIA